MTSGWRQFPISWWSKAASLSVLLALLSAALFVLLFWLASLASAQEFAGVAPAVNLDTIVGLANGMDLVRTGLLILGGLIMLAWVWFTHVELRRQDSEYPIGPIGAVLRWCVPVYNVWGIWTVVRTLSTWGLEHRADADSLAGRLLRTVRRFYWSGAVSVLLYFVTSSWVAGLDTGQVLLRQAVVGTDRPVTVGLVLLLFASANLAVLALMACYLVLVRAVSLAVNSPHQNRRVTDGSH